DLWVFFLATCVLAPGLYLLLRPPYLFERYFFVPLTFFLLLAARTVCVGGKRDVSGRVPPRPEETGLYPVKRREPGCEEAITRRGEIALPQPGSPGLDVSIAPSLQGGAVPGHGFSVADASGSWWQLLVPIVLLMAFLIGNGMTVWRFVQTGRG